MAADALMVPFDEHSLLVMLDTDMHKHFGRTLSGNMLDTSDTNVIYRMGCAWAKYHANRTVLTSRSIFVKLRLRLFDLSLIHI
eukprot:5052111-Pyramimonas_sp.AAC.1